MNDFWKYTFLGNPMQIWMYALMGLVIGLAVIRFIKYVVLKNLNKWTRKTATSVDDFLVWIIKKSVIPLLYLLVFFLAYHYLEVTPKVDKIVNVGLFIATIYFVMVIIMDTIKYLVYSALDKKEDGEIRKKQARGILLIFNIIVWILGFIFLMDNLGYDVTTMLAGLGVGGIAVALAAQSVLGDLFSYFTIFFDKPFDIGDYISVGSESGTIEYIGLKTTRIRTLSGEQLVCSNKDLTDSRLHNYGRMDVRRVVFQLGLVLQTPSEKLKKVPEMVKDIIRKQEGIRFDRAHFTGFGNSRLNFEFVYYLLKSDYTFYMDTHQQVLFAIFDKFEQEGLVMTYPTSSVYVYPQNKDNHLTKLPGTKE